MRPTSSLRVLRRDDHFLSDPGQYLLLAKTHGPVFVCPYSHLLNNTATALNNNPFDDEVKGGRSEIM
jgi:hypothetical protein